MRADRSLRLPLQIGTSGLLSLARGSAFAVPGIILFTIAVAIILWLPDMGDLSGYLFCALATPGAALSLFAYKHLKRAHGERPSDLLVAPDAFAVNGGPHHGLRLAWSEITHVAIYRGERVGDDDDTDQSMMRVRYKTGTSETEIVLAAAERAGEQQSLSELADTLEAARFPTRPSPRETTAVGVFTCASCSAAIAPADAATVVCPYCSHVTPVPDAMRGQIRDAGALQHKPDAAIAKLLDQPGANLVGALFVIAAVFMLVAWPLAILLMLIEFMAESLSFSHTLLLTGFVASCILGFYALIRTRLVDRQALRLLAVDFAAVEPPKPGDPYRCQHCLAPLPAAGDVRVLVRCVYCSTDNVLGLHLGREATVAREESRSLEDAMQLRKREHRRWRGVTFVALGLLFAAWMSLKYGVALR